MKRETTTPLHQKYKDAETDHHYYHFQNIWCQLLSDDNSNETTTDLNIRR